MKQIVVLFFISLFPAISIFSQNTSTTYPKQINDSLVIITTDQLKQTNLIFLEHSKLSKENVLLKEKIDTQSEMISNYKKLDEYRLAQQLELENKIIDLKKQMKVRTNRLIAGGSIVIGASILTLLLLK